MSQLEEVTKLLVESLIEKYQLTIEEQASLDLKETSRRVAHAFEEMLSGYELNNGNGAYTTFPVRETEDHNAVCAKGISFSSVCSHHLLPFIGEMEIYYVPSSRVIGLSKLSRIVRKYSQRLQLQENLTNQVADAIVEILEPKALSVTSKCVHSCVACRGVSDPNMVIEVAVSR